MAGAEEEERGLTFRLKKNRNASRKQRDLGAARAVQSRAKEDGEEPVVAKALHAVAGEVVEIAVLAPVVRRSVPMHQLEGRGQSCQRCCLGPHVVLTSSSRTCPRDPGLSHCGSSACVGRACPCGRMAPRAPEWGASGACRMGDVLTTAA